MAIKTREQARERAIDGLLLRAEIEEFLYHEAELLDERRYSDWLELVADDVHYHMPIRRNVQFGEWDRENSRAGVEVSWFDEDKRTLVGRVRQLETGVHWCEEPASRARHIVSNVQLVRTEGDEVHVRCRFVVYKNRVQDLENLFIGKREDELRRDDETGWKIVKRTIILDQNVLLAKDMNILF
jgi:3-phenylpropionate/cinnamic acid dioxygenase small subunit